VSPRRIGVLFGMERQFPPALVDRINAVGGGEVVAEALRVGIVRQEDLPRYDLILDRISHEVPFYRTYLKVAATRGCRVLNNPFWWSTDDKFLGNVIAQEAGVAVPRTVLVPHKHFPPNTRAESFTNLEFPLDWDAMFEYLGFPIFLKPAYGGGWRDVYRAEDPSEFFAAYDRTRDLCMIAQEGILYSEYFRCYVLGRERVRAMPYDPGASFERRYVRGGSPTPTALAERLEHDCLAICRALGYDFNTVELAVRDGVPYAIDFMNPAPDCDRFSVGDENFEWVVATSAAFLIDRVTQPASLELTGDWPSRVRRGQRHGVRDKAASLGKPAAALGKAVLKAGGELAGAAKRRRPAKRAPKRRKPETAAAATGAGSGSSSPDPSAAPELSRAAPRAPGSGEREP
jgi:glutathione synthase/RimK-type ligase-like ATP-grasp enzyme